MEEKVGEPESAYTHYYVEVGAFNSFATQSTLSMMEFRD